ncbi:Brix domain-containing protein [Polychytrium aggregatum]|uniref:Brix domain-containing protein n=1 Tax=Polychytrium aggregatum TaxID=110093 RepID=UPI0022FE1A29|nr:Brix domain-containing protein [Polychytrium aggregatum]KAI9203418.1 Brix domain-containing protein [Polychytrium aggregatum]
MRRYDEDEQEQEQEDGDEDNEGLDDGDDADTGASQGPAKIRQRVLILSSRGITHRFRHLMNDLNVLMPHSKKDSKFDSKSNLDELNELAELANCNNCIFFEVRKHTDLYMWMSKTPNGPSVKFNVQNVHTMDELRMTGNCLKGSRPILSFDSNFDSAPHFQLLKEMFTQIFGTPKSSRKIKPFIDHVLSFSIADNRIWFRNFQVVEKEAVKGKGKDKEITLAEIGPRFSLSIMRIFDRSFGGATLYENPHFVSPNHVRRLERIDKSIEYKARAMASEALAEKKQKTKMPEDPFKDVFA